MRILILITSDPFVNSISDGLKDGKSLINYWTNGVLPDQTFDRVDIFNADKLVVSGTLKTMNILALEEAYKCYSPSCGGMLPSLAALQNMLKLIFGEVCDPIGNIIIEDFKFDSAGLPCTYKQRSTQKFTFIEI